LSIVVVGRRTDLGQQAGYPLFLSSRPKAPEAAFTYLPTSARKRDDYTWKTLRGLWRVDAKQKDADPATDAAPKTTAAEQPATKTDPTRLVARFLSMAHHRDDQAGRLEHAREAAEVQITAAVLVRRQLAEVGQTSATKSRFQLASV